MFFNVTENTCRKTFQLISHLILVFNEFNRNKRRENIFKIHFHFLNFSKKL